MTDSIADAVHDCEAVVSMLADDHAVEQIVFGDGGVASALKDQGIQAGFAAARYEPALVALYFAQRLLVASIIRFRPVAISLCFLVGALTGGASLTVFVPAYLLR